jgi:hypothetical protein
MPKSSAYTTLSLARLLACILGLYASLATADWRSALTNEQLIGTADFSLYGFDLYKARLWSSTAQPSWRSPFALELIYQRKISKEALIEASLEQIQRIAEHAVYQRRSAVWTEHMRRSFVDVQRGSRITGVYLPGAGGDFYVDGRLQHHVADPQFAKLFFAIWLGPQSRYPEMRAQLMGLQAMTDQAQQP